MLDNQLWERVDRLLEAALEVPAEARAGWLRKACEGVAPLEPHVDLLVESCCNPEDRIVPGGAISGPLWDQVACELGSGESAGTLAANARVGPYEIIGIIASGGMGAVYRARHPLLDREVAVKVLSAPYACDTTSLQRFEREARVLASLNHPNIAAVYDFLWVGDLPYLIMEYIQGVTLKERLDEGPLPIPEALEVAGQIAAALEEAHGKGIIHRDLKPGNIMVTAGGRIKVLDFGLAKSWKSVREPPVRGSVYADDSVTQTGAILGTPGYMSPEQVRGEELDDRSDIWNFGCLLYEMATGRRAFPGGGTSDAAAAVLRDEVAWDPLTARDAPRLAGLVRSCLEKDPAKRLRHVSEVRHVLAECREEHPGESRRTRGWRGSARGAAAMAAGAVLLAALVYTMTPRDVPAPRLIGAVQLTTDEGREDFPVWAPDGHSLAYAALHDGDWDVWITSVKGGEASNRTAANPGNDFSPSWSPDGTRIAYRSDMDGGGIFVMSPRDGPPKKLVARSDAVSLRASPVWFSDGSSLAYTVQDKGGGGAEELEILSLGSGEKRRFPLPGRWLCRCEISLSPDNRFLAYVDAQAHAAQVSQLWLLRMEDGKSILLTDGKSSDWSPWWAPDGRSLFYVSNRGGSYDLWLLPIAKDGAPSGPPEPVTTGVGMLRASLSPAGNRLAYSRGRRLANIYRVPVLPDRPAEWADATQITFDEALIEFTDLSPDGTQLVLSSDRNGNPDLWLMPAEGGRMRELAADAAPEWLPDWSPDGTQIAYYGYRSGNRDIWIVPAAGGPPRQVTADSGEDSAPSWSPDGKSLVFYSNRNGNVDLYRISADGSMTRRLTTEPEMERFPKWSPKGFWIVYNKDAALYLMPADGGTPRRITRHAANYPVWAPEGDRIFFTPPRGSSENVWELELGTGRERPITNLVGRRGRLGREALATDGRYLYFTWEEDRGDIWVAEIVWSRN